MNNESGFALQKASFVLLVFIAGALAYLIVRDRIRINQQRAEAESIAVDASTISPQTSHPLNPREMKSSFAPLRPRAETNTSRFPITRPSAMQPPASASSSQTTGNNVVNGMALSTATSSERPVAAAFTSGRSSSQDSFVAGRVFLRGTPPPEKPVTLDAMCGRSHPAQMTTRHFIVSEDGGLANVLVYVKSGVTSKTPQPSLPLLDNVNCEFQPYVLGVRAGQPFQIRNSDAILHNVHALAKLNREFNVGLPMAGMTLQKTFDKPEVFVQMKCEVHPWMFAYIGVVNHGFFSVTDANGNFELSWELPAGQYTIAAVHPKAGETTQRITVVDSPMPPVNFTLDVPKTLARTETH